MGNIKFGLFVAGFIAVVIWLSTYMVHERELAIKFKLGEIVDTVKEPGIYFKIPFINNIRKFDSRVLTLDTPPERYLTSEKKNVIVDSYVKWRISNPRDYYTSTQGGDEQRAVSRIISILNDEMKGQFGSKTIKEVISGERSAIMQAVNENAGAKTTDLGVELVDVRIKKVELPPDVSDSVYERMKKERLTVAKAFRSAGEEQAKGIRANADRQRTEILAEAYRKSEQIRGDGDALAAKIYADAYGKDKEFYSFHRSLNAYRNSFSNDSDMMVLNPDSDFFRYFKEATGKQ
jgi:modulator of FtsH protease HflC